MESHPEQPVAEWAKVLKVSSSGYYKWLKSKPIREEKTQKRQDDVKRIFYDGNGHYGPERIVGIMRKQEQKKASRPVIARDMTQLGLISSYNKNRKQRSLTDSRGSRGDNLVNLLRHKTDFKPLEAICSDITYLRTCEGWLYKCVIKDIATGIVLGIAMDDNMKKELVIKAFLNANARHNLPPDTIFHSDRGSQYTSKEFMALLVKHKIRQSFSRVGKPGDNSWAESYFASFKKEEVHFKQLVTKSEMKTIVYRWVFTEYNAKRAQKRLGYFSPMQVFNKLQTMLKTAA